MTPEQRGIPSQVLENYLRYLEENHIPMHSLLIARGEDLLLSAHWTPFDGTKPHRLYSVTKSLCALAVGFAMDEGLLTLEDTMEQRFPEELEGQTDENLRHLTVRNMLRMATAGHAQRSWKDAPDDRVRQYFQERHPESRPGGSYFEYDSTGTFILGALVERLTGERLLDYLRRKLFDPIGVSPDVRALMSPGGHTWSDSAFLMKPGDLMKVLRFCAQKGCWNGRQLLSRQFMEEATSCQISNGEGEHIDEQGYGYYIWKAYGEGFFFNGMGSQYALYVPEKDLYFVCNADTQGAEHMTDRILGAFYRMVVPQAGDALPENPAAQASLEAYAHSLTLFAAYGQPNSPLEQAISGRRFALSPNPMGIEHFVLTFGKEECAFAYKNAQGEKRLAFGRCENRFGAFPQDGYSDLVCGLPGQGRYRCAASGAWTSAQTLWLKVQIVDDYFGNMDARFEFASDGSLLRLTMQRAAEEFLKEYEGEALPK